MSFTDPKMDSFYMDDLMIFRKFAELKFGLRLSPSPRKAVLRILRARVKGVSSVAMEGDWTSGGEHAIERADVELQCCAPGIYIILLTKVTSIKKTFLKINKFWGLCNKHPPPHFWQSLEHWLETPTSNSVAFPEAC